MCRRVTFCLLLLAVFAQGGFALPTSSAPPPPLDPDDAACLALLVGKALGSLAEEDAEWDAETDAAAGVIMRVVMQELAADSTAAGQERLLTRLWQLLGEHGAFANPSHLADITEWLERTRRNANEVLSANQSVQDGDALTLRKPSRVQPVWDWVASLGGAGRWLASPKVGPVTGASLAAAEVGVDTQIERTRELRDRLGNERRVWRDNAKALRRVSRLFGGARRRAISARDALPAGSPQQLFYLALVRSLGEAEQMYMLTAVYIQDGAFRCLSAEGALTDSVLILLGRTRPNLMRIRAGQTVLTALDVANVNHIVDWSVAQFADAQDLEIAKRLRALNASTMQKLSAAPYDQVFREQTLAILAETEDARAAWDAGEEERRASLLSESERYYQRTGQELREREMLLGASNAPPAVGP